jgi:hypothetical protein
MEGIKNTVVPTKEWKERGITSTPSSTYIQRL